MRDWSNASKKWTFPLKHLKASHFRVHFGGVHISARLALGFAKQNRARGEAAVVKRSLEQGAHEAGYTLAKRGQKWTLGPLGGVDDFGLIEVHLLNLPQIASELRIIDG